MERISFKDIHYSSEVMNDSATSEITYETAEKISVSFLE